MKHVRVEVSKHGEIWEILESRNFKNITKLIVKAWLRGLRVSIKPSIHFK